MTNTSIPFTRPFDPCRLQDPDERRAQLFQEAPIAYHEIDTDGVIRDVNEAEIQLLGFTREELIGHYVWEFVVAEQRDAARQAVARKVTREQPLAVMTREFRRADGRYVWLEIHEKLIENPEGEVIGIHTAVLDITERRDVEAEIRREHDWMRLVLRSIGNAVVTADTVGNVNYMNPAAEALTGWKLEEAMGCPLEDICCLWRHEGEPVDLMSCILGKPVISDRTRKFVIVHRSGASYGAQWTLSPIANDNRVVTGLVLVIENR